MPETRPAPTTLLNTSRLLIVLGFVMVLATFTLKADESPEKSDWLVLTLGVCTPVAFALGHLLICVGTRCKRMKAAALGGFLCSPGAVLLVVSVAGWYGRSGPMKPEIEPVVCLAWVLFPALAILSVIVIMGADRAFPGCAPKVAVCERCGYDSAGTADDRWLRIAAVLRAWFRTAAAALSTMLKLPTEKRSREKRLVTIAGILLVSPCVVIPAALTLPEPAVNALLSVPFALVVGNVLIWRTTRSPAVRRLAQLSIGLVTAVVLLAIAGQFAPPTHSPSLGWLAVICACNLGAPAAGLLPLVALALRIREFYRPCEKPGFCTKCGYNLTGLRDPRCPECGTPFDPVLLNRDPPSGGATSPPSLNADQ